MVSTWKSEFYTLQVYLNVYYHHIKKLIDYLIVCYLLCFFSRHKVSMVPQDTVQNIWKNARFTTDIHYHSNTHPHCVRTHTLSNAHTNSRWDKVISCPPPLTSSTSLNGWVLKQNEGFFIKTRHAARWLQLRVKSEKKKTHFELRR